MSIMYHTSPKAITKINSWGVAGDCLFFATTPYFMSRASKFVYEADFETVSARQLDDEQAISDIAEKFSVDADTAERILDGRESEWSHGADAESSCWLQGVRGTAAKRMGFDGCEDTDEQGQVFIIPMTGRESELKLVAAPELTAS